MSASAPDDIEESADYQRGRAEELRAILQAILPWLVNRVMQDQPPVRRNVVKSCGLCGLRVLLEDFDRHKRSCENIAKCGQVLDLSRSLCCALPMGHTGPHEVRS